MQPTQHMPVMSLLAEFLHMRIGHLVPKTICVSQMPCLLRQSCCQSSICLLGLRIASTCSWLQTCVIFRAQTPEGTCSACHFCTHEGT